MFDMYDIEDIILGMADIVRENRRLRYELAEMAEYKKKYEDLLDHAVDNANKSTANLLEAIMAGVYSTGKQ